MLTGRASREGTQAFATRFTDRPALYREAQSLTLSTIGIGTYLGGLDDATTRSYAGAICAAVEQGINVIDTSLNYRHQRSELAIRAALVKLRNEGRCERHHLLICTKAGYLVPGAVPGMLREEEVVGGMHSLAPAFLADQLERSRSNLGLETIDVLYLHNPETQLESIGQDAFYARIHSAFAQLEHMVRQGKIAFYGTATWDGYRKPRGDKAGLSLSRLVDIAREVAGDDHHFRFVQLPFNLAMTEAATVENQSVGDQPTTVLGAARQLEVNVIASASLRQGRLASGLPAGIAERFPGYATDAQRAIHFVRSTPGITTALVGMSKPVHVYENVGAAVKARHA